MKTHQLIEKYLKEKVDGTELHAFYMEDTDIIIDYILDDKHDILKVSILYYITWIYNLKK